MADIRPPRRTRNDVMAMGPTNSDSPTATTRGNAQPVRDHNNLGYSGNPVPVIVGPFLMPSDTADSLSESIADSMQMVVGNAVGTSAYAFGLTSDYPRNEAPADLQVQGQVAIAEGQYSLRVSIRNLRNHKKTTLERQTVSTLDELYRFVETSSFQQKLFSALDRVRKQ